jgi:proline iminopeptidase
MLQWSSVDESPGIPILLIHGLASNARLWDGPARRLAELGHAVTAIDLRGHGLSDKPDTGYDIATIADDVLDVVNALSARQRNWVRPLVLGQSWGGMLSMEYCSRYPEKVEKLVLLGSGSPSMNFLNYFSDNILSRLFPEDLSGESDLKSIWPGYFFDRSSGMASKAATDFSKMEGQPGINNIMVNDYAAKEEKRISNLRNFKGQAFVIQGYQDPVGFAAYEIKSAIPQAQLLFVSQSGHFPWLEKESARKQFFEYLKNSLK